MRPLRLTLFALAVFGAATVYAEGETDQVRTRTLIKRLNADTSSIREAAANELSARGANAFPELIDATQHPNREVATRAFEILAGHFQRGTDEVKAAAEKALQHVAESDSDIGRQAKELIDPQPEPAEQQIFQPRIQVIRQQIQVNNGRRIAVKNNNGVTEIEASDKDGKVKIVDDPNNGIKMEITEKKGGKETTRKVEAKDADDLSKKDPEAHRIFKKYRQEQNAIQVQIQIGGGIQAVPVPIPQIQPPNIQRPQNHIQHLEKMIERMQQQAQKNPANAQRFERIIEQLKRHKLKLETR